MPQLTRAPLERILNALEKGTLIEFPLAHTAGSMFDENNHGTIYTETLEIIP